jgi:hypothetical protein
MPDDVSSTLFEVERGQILDNALLRGRKLNCVQFDEVWEYSFSVRRLFLQEIRPDFTSVDAFGIWRNREESDADLMNKLGAQWGAGGDSK